jgi:hypothetical protein
MDFVASNENHFTIKMLLVKFAPYKMLQGGITGYLPATIFFTLIPAEPHSDAA